MAQCFMVATAVTVCVGGKSFVRFVRRLVKFIEQEMPKFNTMCVDMKSEGTVVVGVQPLPSEWGVPDPTGRVQISQLSVKM